MTDPPAAQAETAGTTPTAALAAMQRAEKARYHFAPIIGGALGMASSFFLTEPGSRRPAPTADRDASSTPPKALPLPPSDISDKQPGRVEGDVLSAGKRSDGGGITGRSQVEADWQGPLLARWRAQGWSGWLSGVQDRLIQAARAAATSVSAADDIPWHGGALMQDDMLMYACAMTLEVPGAMLAVETAVAKAEAQQTVSADKERMGMSEAAASGLEGGSHNAHIVLPGPKASREETSCPGDAIIPALPSHEEGAVADLQSISGGDDGMDGCGSVGIQEEEGHDGFELVEGGSGMPLSLPGGGREAKGPALSRQEWQSMLDPGRKGAGEVWKMYRLAVLRIENGDLADKIDDIRSASHTTILFMFPLTTHAAASSDGRLVMLPILRDRVFASGIEASLRREVWKFLLGLYPPCSTLEERETLMSRLREEYQV